MDIDDQVEELLERLWTLREQGPSGGARARRRVLRLRTLAGRLRTRSAAGWLATRGPAIELTPAGEARAAGVIRRHRLAERLLYDVIQVDNAAMEAAACELEHSHILSEEATDRVCAFLGHPPTCPHDRPIPRGTCCEKFTHEVRPLVGPLSEGDIGGEYRIVFIASRSHRRLDRLCALGRRARAPRCGCTSACRPSSSRSAEPTSRSNRRSPRTSSCCRAEQVNLFPEAYPHHRC